MGRVGYAPTTPAMSMQYSTIELTAPNYEYLILSLFLEKIFKFGLDEYKIVKFIAKRVRE